jgi:hypothetical protein
MKTTVIKIFLLAIIAVLASSIVSTSCCSAPSKTPEFKYTIEVKYLDNTVETLEVVSEFEPRLTSGDDGSAPYVYVSNSTQPYRYITVATYVKTVKVLKKTEISQTSVNYN